MNKARGQSRRVLLAIVVMCLFPLVFAGLMYFNQHWLDKRVNRGELILPPFRLQPGDLAGIDDFSAENLSELDRHWVIIHMARDNACLSRVSEALDKTRRVRLMLNKDLRRVRRLLLIGAGMERSNIKYLWRHDERLLRAVGQAELLDRLRIATDEELDCGVVFLMDPGGYVMMWHENGFDPYNLKKDLVRLLTVSRIG